MGQTYRKAEQYLDQLTPGCWVEIGTSRNGDDGSTRTIAAWAKQHGRHLWTVDMDPINCEFARNMNLENVNKIFNKEQQFSDPSNNLFIFIFLCRVGL